MHKVVTINTIFALLQNSCIYGYIILCIVDQSKESSSSQPNFFDVSKELSHSEPDIESINMMIEFRSILSYLDLYLYAHADLVDRLAYLDYTLFPMPAIFETSKDHDKISDSLPSMMLLISKHSSFFNYELVKEVFEKLQDEEGKTKMKVYEQRFESYLRKRCIYVMPSAEMEAPNNFQEVKVELDISFRNCRQVYLKKLQQEISKLLNVEIVQLVVAGIRVSSIHIIFHLLKVLVDSVFPLSDEQIYQITKLKYENADIYSLTCNEFCYDLKGKNINSVAKVLRYLYSTSEQQDLDCYGFPFPHFLSFSCYFLLLSSSALYNALQS